MRRFEKICTLIVGAVHPLTKQTMIHHVTIPIRILKVQTHLKPANVAACNNCSHKFWQRKLNNKRRKHNKTAFLHHTLLVHEYMQHSKWWRFSTVVQKESNMQRGTNINGSI